MINGHRPTLCIIAGPNGSGKTLTTQQLLINEWGKDSCYINPDNIAQEQFGDWNNLESVKKAADVATSIRYECLEKGKDFVFETVLSSAEKLNFVRMAKERGFFIRLFFICTSDPVINVGRIAKRYIDGGHEVPISKTVSRYYRSLENAALLIPVVDRAYVYDNSVDNRLPQLLFRTVDGKVRKRYVPDMPRWAQVLQG